jgi:hypothetical protein
MVVFGWSLSKGRHTLFTCSRFPLPHRTLWLRIIHVSATSANDTSSTSPPFSTMPPCIHHEGAQPRSEPYSKLRTRVEAAYGHYHHLVSPTTQPDIHARVIDMGQEFSRVNDEDLFNMWGGLGSGFRANPWAT